VESAFSANTLTQCCRPIISVLCQFTTGVGCMMLSVLGNNLLQIASLELSGMISPSSAADTVL
jgi:hypothetical protein